MKAILKNSNMLPNISQFLPINQNISFSKSSKELYHYILNPIHNPSINSLYRSQTYLKFYSNSFHNEKPKKEEIFDDYLLTKNNWKLIYQNLMMNCKTYKNKDIVELVYKCFRNHLYLPSIRKENGFLDFKYNSIHQLISYDIILYNNVIYNHYNKYTKEDGFIQLSNNDFILKKGSFFEDELVNFNSNLAVIKNDQNLSLILEKIVKYDYENLDEIHLNNGNNNKSIDNEVINFLLWLNHTVVTFSKFVFSYVRIYSIQNNNINNNKLISEFIIKHNDFVNFSLLINEHFNNINIIINYLDKFILRENHANDNSNNNIKYFSIYKMCINIMKKEIYDKLKNNLKIKFEKITYQYINDLFEKKENEFKEINDSKTKEDSNNSFEEFEDYDEDIDCSILDNTNEISKKELVENFMLSIADYSINEFNSNLINHSELKMNDDYLNYEILISNAFINIIKKNLEEKSFSEVFEVFIKVISMQNDEIDNKLKDNEIGLHFIRRTKKNIFCKIINYLKIFIGDKIKEELLDDEFNSKKNYWIKKNILINNIENKLNAQQKIDFLNLYYNEINEIKKRLSIKNNEKQINNFFCICDNYYLIALKNIIYCYNLNLEYYSHFNNKIIDVLLKTKDKKFVNFINESITNN